MSDWPKVPPAYTKVGILTTSSLNHSPAGWSVVLGNVVMTTSTAWGTADVALYVPVYLGWQAKVYKLSVMNGGTVGGNTDVGIYNERGVRLVSSTPTLQSGTSTIQTFDVTDTLLNPGVYYLALANTTTTGTYLCGTTTAVRMRSVGAMEQTGLTSGTLPNPAVFATFTRTFVPVIMAHYSTVV